MNPQPDDVRHPWRQIDLDVYERHMSDVRVGQLEQLHRITAEQLTSYPSRRVGWLGVAGGNGLDLVDPAVTDLVVGYDINADYLQVCEERHRARLGPRLLLAEAKIDRALRIEPVDLLIANLIVEYVGVTEFAAFASANADRVRALSCVVQRNDKAGFVSATEDAAAFDVLGSVASDVAPAVLEAALVRAGYAALGRWDHPLPNGKTLVRLDFRTTAAW